MDLFTFQVLEVKSNLLHLLMIIHVNLYLSHEKTQYVDVVEAVIKEVERQRDRKVKIIWSDRGGEFSGKYDEI